MSATPCAIRHYQSVAAQAARLPSLLDDKLDAVVRIPEAMTEFSEFVAVDLGWLISAALSGEIEFRTDGTQDHLIRRLDALRAKVNAWGATPIAGGMIVDTFLSVDEEG